MNTRSEKLEEQERSYKKESFKKGIKKVLVFLIILGVSVFSYAYFIEPKLLFIHEHVIESEKISKGFEGVKILHFSDLHYGSSINRKNIDKVIEKLNSSKPDIIVFTGDLIEETYNMTDEDIKILTNSLNNLKAGLGKYGVYGNHDMLKDDSLTVFNNSDFTVLKNSYDLVYKKDNKPIMIFGTDDVLYGEPDISCLNEDKFQDYYKIVLVHEPDFADRIASGKADLILSGHSHNGQVNIPGIKKLALPMEGKKYYSSYYKVNDNDLYVSNGIGCSLFNIRLFSVPSYNLFRIKDK